MNDTTTEEPMTWGQWIKKRSLAVGHRNNGDLADAVGCNAERITQWFRMSEPPEQMRKGFSTSLARALQTDRRTLFTDYTHIDPATAPSVNHLTEDSQKYHRDLLAAAECLGVDQLRALANTARVMAAGSAA